MEEEGRFFVINFFGWKSEINLWMYNSQRCFNGHFCFASPLGLDPLMMILEKKDSIREVMAYPKTGSGEDYLFGAPSVLSEKKVGEANVKSV